MTVLDDILADMKITPDKIELEIPAYLAKVLSFGLGQHFFALPIKLPNLCNIICIYFDFCFKQLNKVKNTSRCGTRCSYRGHKEERNKGEGEDVCRFYSSKNIFKFIT